MTSSRPWVSIHLFYHDDLALPILHWVRPLVEELHARNWLQSYFFLRYWQGGPHIRLRLLPSASADLDALKNLLEEQASNFLHAYPSTSVIDPQGYTEASAYLSQAEYHTDQRIPLFPNNSYQYIPYEPEYRHYGGPAALPVIETFFMASSDLAGDLLVQGLTRKQATSHCLSAMLLVAALDTTDAASLALRFEQYFLGWERMPRQLAIRLNEQFARQYAQQRAQIRTLVLACLEMSGQETLNADLSTTPLARWLASARSCFARLDALNRETLLRTEHSLPDIPTAINILLRAAHMHNNRLGILLLEEAYLLFLLKESLREIAANISNGAVDIEESADV